MGEPLLFEEENYLTDGCISSAKVIAPLLLEDKTDPTRNVVDVGAGQGWFAAEFLSLGCNVMAIDLRRPKTTAPQVPYIEHDLTKPLVGPLAGLGTWDLAVCLEVAEHLPVEAGPMLVENVVSLAPAVLWSAAIPGQTGHGHINLQWPAYWDGLFKQHGYGCSDELRWLVWDDERVEVWYRQNLMLYELGVDALCPPAVVHPSIWGWAW